MHPFRAYISLHSEISDKDWNNIQPYLTYQIIQQDRILLNQGAICKNLYFLENGLIRFFTSKGDENLIDYVIQSPFLFTSVQSFIQQIPSNQGIQAGEESSLWIISRDDVLKFLEIPAWNNFISNLSSSK